MNWRAITSALGQAGHSVYRATQEIIDVTREALSPQGLHRSFEALSEAGRSYWKDLSSHPLAWVNPFTLPMAPLDIFSRLKSRDQERLLIQAGVFGVGGWMAEVSPFSLLFTGMGSYLSGSEAEEEVTRVSSSPLRELIPFRRGACLISPVGTPDLEELRRRN